MYAPRRWCLSLHAFLELIDCFGQCVGLRVSIAWVTVIWECSRRSLHCRRVQRCKKGENNFKQRTSETDCTTCHSWSQFQEQTTPLSQGNDHTQLCCLTWQGLSSLQFGDCCLVHLHSRDLLPLTSTQP